MAAFETLTDSFSGSSINTAKWSTLSSDGASVSSGQLNLLAVPGGNQGSVIKSQSTYSLVNSYVFVKIVSAPDQTNSVTALTVVNPGFTFEAKWQLYNNSLQAFTLASQIGSGLTYNSSVHKYLRIRATSTTVYWDYSTDSITWTNYASDSSQTLADSNVFLEYNDNINTNTGIFDSFNVQGKYWVGGAGNWSNSSHWAVSSGGTGGASVPTSDQDAFFDANSFSSAGQTVTVDTFASCHNLDFTGSNNPALDISSGVTLGIYGGLTLISGMSIPANGRTNVTIAFNSMETGNAITMAGQSLPTSWGSSSVQFQGPSGEWILQDAFNASAQNLTVANGTLRTNGKTVTCNVFSTYSSAQGLDLGSSTINCSEWDAPSGGPTFTTGTSTINVGVGATTTPFNGGGQTYYNVVPQNSVKSIITGANTFNNLTLQSSSSASVIFLFPSNATQTINGSFSIGNANSGHLAQLRASITGTPFTVKKTSGIAVLNYADLQDSTATGGARFYASNSTDSGDNTGWTFGIPTYTFSLSSTSVSSASGTIMFHKEVYAAGSDNTSFSSGSYLSRYQPLSQKDYEYRVFDHAGNYIGIWQDVTSDFAYQQAINQAPTELTVQIARSPNNVVVKYDPLLDTSSNTITDTDGNVIYLSTQTPNAVGAGTDVMENYNVDVYAFYGGYDVLQDTNGNPIQDTAGDNILVGFGFPSGKRVYSGYIADYDLQYGQQTGVTVTIVPHVVETEQMVNMDLSGNTTRSYSSVDPVQMARDAMDSYAVQGGSKISYTTASMPLSGQTATYDFKLQTVRESIDKTIDLLPSGYYQFADPGENIQYLLNKGSTADHTFYYEKHLTAINLKKSISQLVNDVYFVGGDPGTGSPLFKHYSNSTSISTYRRGLQRMSDSRVTLATSASSLANQQINEFKNPRYRTSITITDTVYDIESIKLGQMVGFANFGTFVDTLILQIVNISREKHQVTLDLDMIVPSDTKRLYELKKELQAEQVRGIATAPA